MEAVYFSTSFGGKAKKTARNRTCMFKSHQVFISFKRVRRYANDKPKRASIHIDQLAIYNAVPVYHRSLRYVCGPFADLLATFMKARQFNFNVHLLT